MFKGKRAILAFVAVLVMGVAQSARAGLVYRYVTDQSNYAASTGATVTVRLFIQETVTAPSTSLIASDGGLFGAGIKVDQRALNKPLFPSILSTVVRATEFDSAAFSSATVTPTSAAISDSINFGSPGVQLGNTSSGTVTNPLSAGRVYLGSVTVTAGSAAGVTTFDLSMFDPNGGGSLTNNSSWDLDIFHPTSGSPTYTATGTNPSSFTVTVAGGVPEPTSLALCALGAMSTLGWRVRRRV